MICAVLDHWDAIGGWMYLISIGECSESSCPVNAKLTAKQQSIDAGTASGSRLSSGKIDKNKTSASPTL
jgi:hypothetical protein